MSTKGQKAKQKVFHSSKGVLICPIEEVSVDERSLLLVYGFSRDLHHPLYQSLPSELLLLCAQLYMQLVSVLDSEYFKLHSNKYSVDSSRIVLTKTGEKWERHSAFGNACVHSMCQRVHCWTFEALHVSTSMSFGITDYSDEYVERDFAVVRDTHNYCVQHAGHRRSRGVAECKYQFYISAGTIIRMELNLVSKQLIFHVDDKCLGPVYDIECGEDIFYKMAVLFLEPKCSVRLIDYTDIKYNAIAK